MPKLLVLNKGSNTRGKTSGAIPRPVSMMVISAQLAAAVEIMMVRSRSCGSCIACAAFSMRLMMTFGK